MSNKSSWTERRARLVELQKNYPIFKDILKINRLINTFTFTQRSDEIHEANFIWLENKLKEMSK
jgi:hypothetical protein